jgi:hypothetical protein
MLASQTWRKLLRKAQVKKAGKLGCRCFLLSLRHTTLHVDLTLSLFPHAKKNKKQNSQGRQKLLEARLQVQELMRELTSFLNVHYPPIQPDVCLFFVHSMSIPCEDMVRMCNDVT